MTTHHPYFMTMNLQLKDGSHIDIAQARSERYPKPAILPKVSPAKIEEDLKRRDFSINAIAMEITAKPPYPIYDPFDGRGDLDKKLIRVLHPKSFIDDPTRIFRAIRFATRFKLKIEPQTKSLMQEVIKNNLLKLLSKERILNEIKLMLAEQKHTENIRYLQNYGIIANLFDLNLPKRFFGNNDKLTAYENDIKKMRLIHFLSYLPISHWRKYPLTTEIVESTYALIKFSKIRGHLAKAKKPSEIYKILKPLPIIVLEILSSIESQAIKEKVKKYLNEYSKIAIYTNGNVLRSMKIQQGQLYTQILKQILYEKLDGRIKTKQDEINYIKMKYG
jgi:tRNA nucleotidyltransferase/poly(A) polymerase